MIKGAMQTISSLGLSVLFNEAIRRATGKNYFIKEIPVLTSEQFRTLRNLSLRSVNFYRNGDSVVAATEYGQFLASLSDYVLLNILSEDKTLYSYGLEKGKSVVDIGSHIGDTPVFFIRSGASKVYAFEPDPIKFKYLLINIELNHLVDKIVPLPYAVFSPEQPKEETEKINLDGAITFDQLPSYINDIDNIGLVKFDCEGCEYSLLHASDNSINQFKNYLIEIHINPKTSPKSLIEKMEKLGYKAILLDKIKGTYGLFYFKK
ncbi:MAG: FkbM family methyltransferase [Conexivisphaerales archaeon]